MSDAENLRAELDALRAELTALRTIVDSARPSATPTMRRCARCPACGCTRIAHAPSVLDRADAGTSAKLALHDANRRWWQGPGSGGAGELEVYACTDCGLVEWYVKAPDKLTEGDEQLRIIDGSSGERQAPYR